MVILMILDGWGIGREGKNNAIYVAKKPFYDSLLENYPHTKLNPAGPAVGLPEGIMGNSEVGHLNLGAGRVVMQDIVKISKSIEDGSFFENPVLLKACENVKAKKSKLHLMGLLSDGGVHSTNGHLYALLELAKKQGIKEVYVHPLFDGRDTPPTSGIKYLKQLLEKIKEIGVGKVATLIGRFYAMDRDKRWDRVEKAYRALVFGEGEKVSDPVQALKDAYGENETDEFIVPKVILDEKENPVAKVTDGDSLIFFNFRGDRAREISHAFTDEKFSEFERREKPEINFVCFTEYEANINAPIAFPQRELKNTLGEVVSKQGLTQLRIAETEKYAHVTFFFNGGEEKKFPGEDRILVPSPREVKTYDEKPEMSAFEVTEKVVEDIKAKKHDVIILNYANGDMVGHTGVKKAAIKAVEAVDSCIKRVIEAMLEEDGTVILTSDHGNCEEMADEEGQPHTSHTHRNLVPFFVIDKEKKIKLKDRVGVLADVAPTLLDILGIKKPSEMTGESLISGKN